MREIDTKEPISPPKKQSLRPWLIAFFAPFFVMFALGCWMQWSEDQQDSGRHLSDLGRELTTGERVWSASYMGVILGIGAGLLGLAGRGVYVVIHSRNRSNA